MLQFNRIHSLLKIEEFIVTDVFLVFLVYYMTFRPAKPELEICDEWLIIAFCSSLNLLCQSALDSDLAVSDNLHRKVRFIKWDIDNI